MRDRTQALSLFKLMVRRQHGMRMDEDTNASIMDNNIGR